LHISCARLLGRCVDSGYDAVYAVRQGCHDHQTGRREVENHFVGWHTTVQPHVGQHEGLSVAAADERDP
jgi:hypothetical protein